MRDKTHMEFVERWARFVRSQPREKWKPRLNAIIDSQFERAWEFYRKLGKTVRGREVLRELRGKRGFRGG